MSGFYGYNPGEYVTNWSWLGDVGNVFAKTVSSMPELAKMNREIKENKMMKHKEMEALYTWLDKIPNEKLVPIASAMKLNFNDPEEARNQIKAMIPDANKTSEKTTNEQFTLDAAKFVSSFVGAAKSEVGGIKDIGELLAVLPSGNIQESFRTQTHAGQTLTKDDEYAKSFERGGKELKRDLGMRNESTMDLTKQQDQLRVDKFSQFAPKVNEILKDKDLSSEDVFRKVFQETNDMEVAQKAADQRATAEAADLRRELQETRDRARMDVENAKNLTKIYDVDKLSQTIATDMEKLLKYQALLKNSENMDPTEKADFTATVNMLKKGIRVKEQALVKLKEVGDTGKSITKDDANKAILDSEADIVKRSKQDMINLFNENTKRDKGGFAGGGLWGLGRKDDYELFKQRYRDQFGEEPPKLSADGKTLESSGGATTTTTTTQNQKTSNIGKELQITKIKNLIKALEERKKTNPEEASAIDAALEKNKQTLSALESE
jgi:hypothetical protein